MRRSTAPTLKDVAAEAGVTSMVASVVLNGATSSTRVSAATRARILEAASRLDYRRNFVARSLSRRLTDTIGVVSIVDGKEVNLYFLEVFNGIMEAAAERKQNVAVFSIDSWLHDEERILGCFDGRVDGLVLIAPHSVKLAFLESLPTHTPCVMMHSCVLASRLWNIDLNNASAALTMTTYLIQQGHQRIAHFTGPLDWTGPRERLAGYREGLERAGIAYSEKLVFRGDFNAASGRVQASEMLARFGVDDLPTAIFCASDAIAYGCIEVLAARGVRVPQHVSVAGFDDTLLAQMTQPPLTTIRQPFRQMGRRAVELLLPQIRSDIAPAAGSQPHVGSVTPRAELFAVELVVRDSVAPPRS